MDVPWEALYERMVLMRRVEEELASRWWSGELPGELHLGIGEEGIVAGVLAHRDGRDAVASDHRSTLPFVAVGSPIEAIVGESLGLSTGLGRGQGGHMHLMDPARSAAANGIVGAGGPLACGFALAAQQRRDGGVAFAFFGEGAMNQGMLMEALNLAAAWSLPVVFVCKDNGWSILTRSAEMTGGKLVDRARGLGVRAVDVDGTRVDRVLRAAERAVEHARAGRGPFFLHATCHHPTGHFLGDALVSTVEHPAGAGRVVGPIVRGMREAGGAGPAERARALGVVSARTIAMAVEQLTPHRDPLDHARRHLDDATVAAIDSSVARAVEEATVRALAVQR